MDEFAAFLENSSGRQIFSSFLEQKFGDNALLEKFDALTKIYLQVNSIINISALRTSDDIYIKHYLDSVYPSEYFVGNCCDVGCGGGFPTLPIALVNPDNHITGVDSVGKKLLLIHRSISELHIKNVSAEYARSEYLVKLHKSYDTVCARALADTDKALSYCAPLAKIGGRILLYKTQNDKPAKPESENKYGVTLDNTVDYVLTGTDIKRRLFIYKK